MKSHARVVVIGGGIAGCSTLYHLTQDRKAFVAMNVECEIAASHAGDPVFLNDVQIGTVTSGGYGHRIRKNIALAFIDTKAAAALQNDPIDTSSVLAIGILGQPYPAQLAPLDQYDPQNKRVRA